MDAINILMKLKSLHEQGKKSHGVDVLGNGVEDMFKIGVVEPVKVKTQAIESAMEVATMILRIDDVIASKKKEAQPGQGGPQGMPPGMGGGMGGMGGMPEM